MYFFTTHACKQKMLLHTVSQIIMRNMNDRPTSLTDNPWTGLAKTAIGTLGQQGAVGKYGNVGGRGEGSMSGRGKREGLLRRRMRK